MFIVENNSLRLKKKDWVKLWDEKQSDRWTFDDTLSKGLIEFLDVEEEEVSMIAMKIEDLQSRSDYCNTYTHCEIHPSMILGVCASIIPFPDHNQVYKSNNRVQEILINQLWVSKQWEFTLVTII